MKDEFIKIIGLIVIIAFLVFLATKTLKFHLNVMEGLTNPSTGTAVTSSTVAAAAGNAQTLATTLKNAAIQGQDTLLISKYRTDYENVIVGASDLINNMMLTTLITNFNPADPSGCLAALNQINTLNDSQVSLNNIMKYVDAQS